MKSRLVDWTLLGLVSVISTILVWLPIGMTRVYENFDGPYYLVVAKSWYDKEFIGQNFSINLPNEYFAAHLPLYPLFISLTGRIGHINFPQTMLVVNILASVLLGVTFFEIAKRMKLPHPLFLASTLLFVWPRMWAVRSVGSPETLFILFIISSLFCFENKKYFWAGVLGALATLTKSPGILLFVAYALQLKKTGLRAWPVVLMPIAGLALFYFYQFRMGDFLAYFHSGDNIHLQVLPFKIFDSTQPWVGTHWLEDVLWIYLVGAIGVWLAFKKSSVWGTYGAVFLATILFVSHRDIARYSLPIVPVVLVGLSDIFKHREVRWILVLLLIPAYFYTLNFLNFNYSPIADWTPYL